MAIALQGQIRHQINGVEMVEATNISIDKNQPLTVKKGTAGYIGTAKGIGDTRIRLTFAQPALRSQFETFAMTASEGLLGFTYTFQKGISIFVVTNCFAGNAGLTNDPASGNIDNTVEIQGAEMRQLS